MSSHQRQRVRRDFSLTLPQTAQASSSSATTWRENLRQRFRASNSSRIILSSRSLNIVTLPEVHSVGLQLRDQRQRPAGHKLIATLQSLCFHYVVLTLQVAPLLERSAGNPLMCDRQSIGSDLHGGVGNKYGSKGLKWEIGFPISSLPLRRFRPGRPVWASIVASTAVRYNSSVPWRIGDAIPVQPS